MITIEKYTERSIVVRGDTKPYVSDLKAMGGRWNSNLSGGAGWIFSVEREGELQSWMYGLQPTTPQREEKVLQVPQTPVKPTRDVNEAVNRVLSMIEENRFSPSQKMALIHALSSQTSINRRLNMDDC